MNPNALSGRLQAGGFHAPSTTGIFPAQPQLQFDQLSLFGQKNGGLSKNTGVAHLPDFNTTSGPSGTSGQGLTFGQSPGFMQPHSVGQSVSFMTSAPTSSSVFSKQGFSFKPPTNLGTSQGFGTPSGETSSSGFVRPGFSFKTPENAVFKPIFGTNSEQEKMLNPGLPAPFTFSLPGSGGPARLAPFGISHDSSNSGVNTSFSFPKPVSSNTLVSSFASLPSKTIEDDKKRTMATFASPSFTSFSSTSSASLPLGDTLQFNKVNKPEIEEIAPLSDQLPIHGKGTKRKEEQAHSPKQHDYDAVDELELLSRSDHSSNKRPVRLNRPRVGSLFGRTLQDVLKSNKKQSKMERISLESREIEQSSTSSGSQSGFTMARPAASQKKEENKAKLKEGPTTSNPLRRNRNSGSMESLGGLPPSELTVFHCKNIPDCLNDKDTLEKYFKKFIKIQRIRSYRNKKLAVIHCSDHASAVLARKKAKSLHKDIVTFWYKKKPSPNKRDYSSKEQKADGSKGRQSSDQLSHQHSPQHKSLVRSSGSGSLSNKSSPAKKPGLKKSLQFEAHNFDSGSEGLGSENLESSSPSFSNLVGMVAETSEDKYRLLDQRDKVMRQARVKQMDLGKAKTFVGTCPDMCPEKERYMRETRNQLSIFEVLPGTDKVDHTAAVKEYSRSSADQEEPLPHELRSSEVLSMTMDYLVTHIMDKGEGKYREWYDFVWNRTRGIRKDITQQHLCCPLTVSLIEKCTRFHIHCSHHLCEEPMSSFDAKINNENMTKCLQSLKEMYQDLANKGIYCKSEAEFRGYNVLLNLNKGDILREVQQFRPAVRNSLEVRFAVQAFSALNSNNFVRFFKLVQTASYLNACLLHCYFNQIRRDALKSLNFAYTVNAQRSTIFPLDNVVRMLLFRDFEDATDFISYFGLSVSDGSVELNRSAFLEPESLPKPKKSLFVGQKLTVSVGEIVNGGPLPPMSHHVPLCSFNAQNKYIGENAVMDSTSSSQKASADMTVLTMEQITEGSNLSLEVIRAQPSSVPLLLEPAPLPSTAGPTFQPVAQPSPPPPKPQPIYNDMDIAEVVDDLVHDVLEGECRDISNTGAAYAQSALWFSDIFTEQLMTEVLLGISKQIASVAINEERERLEEEKRLAEEERQKQEKERLIKMLSESLNMDLTKEVVMEMMQEISAKELKSAVEKDQRARIARCSNEVSTEIMAVFLEDEIFQISKETLQELQCFCKYLKRWREAVAARKKLKRQMRAFPAAPCCVDPKCQLKALSPSAECPIAREHLAKSIVNLGHAGKLGTSCLRLRWQQNQTIHQIKVQHFYQQLLRDAVWTPLNLPSLIVENIPVLEENVFWKALLLLPSCEEYSVGNASRILVDWLKAKFRIDTNLKEFAPVVNDGIQTLALKKYLHMHGDQAISVNVCIKAAHGTLDTSDFDNAETQKELLGTSGLILLLSSQIKSEDVAEKDVYWLSTLLQLKYFLQSKPFQPVLPLVVLVPSHGDEVVEKEVEEGLRLPDLISDSLISSYKIVEMPDSVRDLQGTNKLTNAVQWLVSQCPSTLKLYCQTLMQYVEDGLDGEFSQAFYQDKKERRMAGLPSQDPSAIIELYNSVIQFLAEVASSTELLKLSWPVTEFVEPGGNKVLPHLQWNTSGHLAWLKKALLSFQIPQMDLPPSGAPWQPVCSMIFQYLSQTATSPQTKEILQSQVKNLLSRTYLKWKGGNLVDSEADGPSVEEIPWDSILALCVNHKLRDWKPPRLPVIPEAVTKDGQVYVYFFKEHLKKFIHPLLWEEARLKTQKEIQQGRSKVKILPLAKRYSYPLSSAACCAKQRIISNTELNMSSTADLTTAVSEMDSLPERLSTRLQLEKNESRSFEEKLQQLLVKDSETSQDFASLPLYLPGSLLTVPHIIHPLAKTPVSGSPKADNKIDLKNTDTSFSQRLAYLTQLIRANKEEEMTCELHLSTLLDMTDD